MKTVINPEVRGRVLALRATETAARTSTLTGVSINTVKSVWARASKDNQKLRALCTLPEPTFSPSTGLMVNTLPAAKDYGADAELNALLWLRDVITTGTEADIEKALAAAKCLKSTPKELGDRYTKHLISVGAPWFELFRADDCANLESLASSRLQDLRNQREAVSRFGSKEALLNPSAMEEFCTDVLSQKHPDETDSDAFSAHRALRPNTLSDCLHELAYWVELRRLRGSFYRPWDDSQEVRKREDFLKQLLYEVRPVSREEARAVFDHVIHNPDGYEYGPGPDYRGESYHRRIMRNLIG